MSEGDVQAIVDEVNWGSGMSLGPNDSSAGPGYHRVTFAWESVPTRCWAASVGEFGTSGPDPQCYALGTGPLGLCPRHAAVILPQGEV